MTFSQLSVSYASTLQRLLVAQVPMMNIFNLHNALWGLARMGADVHFPLPPATQSASTENTMPTDVSVAALSNYTQMEMRQDQSEVLSILHM